MAKGYDAKIEMNSYGLPKRQHKSKYPFDKLAPVHTDLTPCMFDIPLEMTNAARAAQERYYKYLREIGYTEDQLPRFTFRRFVDRRGRVRRGIWRIS